MCATAQLEAAQIRLPATGSPTVSQLGNGREPNGAWHQPAKPMKGRQDRQLELTRASSLIAKSANLSRPELSATQLPASSAKGWQGRRGFAAETSVESATRIMDANMQPAVASGDSVARDDAHAAPTSAGVIRGRNLRNLPSLGDGPAARRQSTRPPLH